MFRRIIDIIIRKLIPWDRYARLKGVNIGNNNFVSSIFWGTEPYLITIGNHCQITNGVKILTHGGGQILRDLDPNFDVFGKVIISDWVYIGNNAMIMPGVIVEDHVLIAAGSVVTKSVPAGCVIAGNPARIICKIDEYAEKNKHYNVGTKRMSIEQKKMFLKSLSDDKFIQKGYMRF